MAGGLDAYGRDATPALRANYGLILNILAIPGIVERLHDDVISHLGLDNPNA